MPYTARTLTYSSCRLLALSKDLPLATFLYHLVPSIPDISITSKVLKLWHMLQLCPIPKHLTHQSHQHHQLALIHIDFQISSLTHLNKSSHPHLQVHFQFTIKNKVICTQEAKQSPISPFLQKSYSHPPHPNFHFFHNFYKKTTIQYFSLHAF